MTVCCSVARRYVAVVNERIQGLLDLHASGNDPRLLQRKPRLENAFALRGTDLVVRELGAFLELLVDDRSVELGGGDEYPLELVIVQKRCLARVLIDGKHTAHEVSVILQKLLARVQDSPGVRVLIA